MKVSTLDKLYHKFKEDFLEEYKDFIEFENYPFNYIGVGRFFELLDLLKLNKFDITDARCFNYKDADGDTFGITITIDSDDEHDSIETLIIDLLVNNNQMYDEDIVLNEPNKDFFYTELYGFGKNGFDDMDSSYPFERKDVKNIVEWLKNNLNTDSTKTIYENFKDIIFYKQEKMY